VAKLTKFSAHYYQNQPSASPPFPQEAKESMCSKKHSKNVRWFRVIQEAWLLFLLSF
jgi:hypothetical protein